MQIVGMWGLTVSAIFVVVAVITQTYLSCYAIMGFCLSVEGSLSKGRTRHGLGAGNS